MATLAENAALIKAAQEDIDEAIRIKGGTTDGGLSKAAAAIAALPSGDDAWLNPDETEYVGRDILMYLDIPFDGFEFYHYANSENASYPMICDWGDGSEQITLGVNANEKKSHLYNRGRYVLRIYPSSDSTNCHTGVFQSNWSGIFYSGVAQIPTDSVSSVVRKLCVGTCYVERFSALLGGFTNLSYLLVASAYPVSNGYYVFAFCNVSVFANVSELSTSDYNQASNQVNSRGFENGLMLFGGAREIRSNLKHINNHIFSFAKGVPRITLGNGVVDIAANSLSRTTGVVEFASKAETPPVCADATSLGSWYAKSNLRVMVPAMSVSAYLLAPYWCLFGSKIMPIGATDEQVAAASNGEYIARFENGEIVSGAAYDAQTATDPATVTWDSEPFTADEITAIESLMTSKNYTVTWR